MKIDTYKCDECATQKGENNHWFRFTGFPDQFSVTDWNGSDYPATIHLCSDTCVIKSVQKWLSAQQASKEEK